jgi:hypothetical protein
LRLNFTPPARRAAPRRGFCLDFPAAGQLLAGVAGPGGWCLALDAKAAGFKVYAVTDASGDPSEFASRTTPECKGGIINTKHPGQQSRLRRRLCEAIGLSLASPRSEGRRQFAVVPLTKVTENLARRMRRHRPRRLSLRRTRHLSRRPVKLVKVSRQIAAKQLWRTLAVAPRVAIWRQEGPAPNVAAASQVDQAG